MSYEVKFGWFVGYELGWTAFQPDGTGRGIPNQHLPEVVWSGYYRDTPATDLVIGDVVRVHRREEVEHEDIIMHYLEYEDVYHEGIQMHWEGDYVKDLDTQTNQQVVWIENAVGSGEFVDEINQAADTDNIINRQAGVFNVYDERTGVGAGAGAGDGVESTITHDC